MTKQQDCYRLEMARFVGSLVSKKDDFEQKTTVHGLIRNAVLIKKKRRKERKEKKKKNR